MSAIDGQRAGPNWLNFFREPMGTQVVTKIYKNLIYFQYGNIFSKFAKLLISRKQFYYFYSF